MPQPPGYSQALQSDPSFVLQIAEKEQELLASQETVQVKAHWEGAGGGGGLGRWAGGSRPLDLTSVWLGLGLADEGETLGALAPAQERAHRRPLPEAPAGRA